jgi:hypothetical protein
MFKFLSKLFGGAGEQPTSSPTEATPAPDAAAKADAPSESAPAPETSETPAVDAGSPDAVDAAEAAPMTAEAEPAAVPEKDEGQSMAMPSSDDLAVVDASWHPSGAWVLLKIDAGEGAEPRFVTRMIHGERPVSKLLAQADTLEGLATNPVRGASNEVLDENDPLQMAMVAARDALKAEAAE